MAKTQHACPVGQTGAGSLALPTLGGLQFWCDIRLHAGWRIQRNILSGRHRLLDPRNRPWASGTLPDCRSRFETLRAANGIAPQSDHLVLMIHGIARSAGTFRVLRRTLRAKGYDAAAITYPSTRRTIGSHAEALSDLLDALEGTKTVSFVTHSMGGLVLRRLLAAQRPWMHRIEVGRIVMIAPPNQGSAVVDWLKNSLLYKALFGPAGQQLVPDAVADIPGLSGHDFAIVAGGRGDGKGYNPWLEGDDDGTVRVAETMLASALASLTLPYMHGGISNRPGTVHAAAMFIETGVLPDAPGPEDETNKGRSAS